MTLSRRLLSLLGVSATAYATTMAGLSAQSAASADLDVAIVGAGAAGLTAGYLLQKSGLRFQVFEAADRYGGRAMKNDTFADFPLDMGGEWIHGPKRLLREISGDKAAMGRATEYRPMTADVIKDGVLRRRNGPARAWRGEQRFINTTWYDFLTIIWPSPSGIISA